MKKFVILFALLSLTGCQNETKIYDVKKVGSQTYLINQQSGELSIVVDGKVIMMSTYQLPRDKKLTLDGSFNDLLQFNVNTKQIVDRMYYQLNLKGFNEKTESEDGSTVDNVADFSWYIEAVKKHEYDRITLQFEDTDDFALSEYSISLAKDYTQIVNAKGDVTGFRYEGSYAINPLKLANVNKLSYVYRIAALKDAPKDQKQP